MLARTPWLIPGQRWALAHRSVRTAISPAVVGIGGVLEPLQAEPVIIEDNCFIGARSEVVEGVIVKEGAVLSMGVFLSGSTKIVDRHTGEIHIGTCASLFGCGARLSARRAEPTEPFLRRDR